MPNSSPTRVLANDFARQWQDIGSDALEAVDRVGHSGWLVLGEESRMPSGRQRATDRKDFGARAAGAGATLLYREVKILR